MSVTLPTKCAIMRLSRLRLTDNLSFITGHHYYDWVDLYERCVLGILPSSYSFSWSNYPMECNANDDYKHAVEIMHDTFKHGQRIKKCHKYFCW